MCTFSLTLTKVSKPSREPSRRSKSDRINALRKQYDAFLDEDKKRKDRNEFILGRLEKMRLYTPAVLPVRHSLVKANAQISKYSSVTEGRPEHLRKIRFDENPILYSRSSEVLSGCVITDEQRVLQEISKKYILIPKLRALNENRVTYYNPASVSNDGDWRQKYTILDELKKIEKEGSSEVSKQATCDTFNNREKIEPCIAAPENIREQELYNRVQIPENQQNNEKALLPELVTSDNKTVLTDNIDSGITLKHKQDVSQYSVNHGNNLSDSNKVIEEVNASQSSVQENENKNINNLIYNEAEDVKINETQLVDNIVSTNENVKNLKNETITQNNTAVLSQAHILETYMKAPVIEKENIDFSLKTDEIVAHPVESIDNVEPCTSISQSEPVLEKVQHQEYEPNNEITTDNDNIISSQIDEFEAEQKEMFYSEETEYNKNVDTTGYNNQNEEYTNEQYSYYNESQQEQPYYNEINEHEEATERYDPNYQQQYVENYEENVNVAQYENQQYVEDGYENEPQVTNINYDQHPDQQEVTNETYEQQPGQEDLTNTNYEQQPINYDYEYSTHHENQNQNQIENTYDSQAGEGIEYATHQYEGEVENPAIPDQNVYESQQNNIPMHTEQETIKNLEQQLDKEDLTGYTGIQNMETTEPVAPIENVNKIESNIKET